MQDRIVWSMGRGSRAPRTGHRRVFDASFAGRGLNRALETAIATRAATRVALIRHGAGDDERAGEITEWRLHYDTSDNALAYF